MAYQLADIWTYYRGRIQYRNKLMGPTPLNPKSIEAWIRKGMGIDDVDELKRQVIKTAIELGYEANDDMTVEQLQELAEKMARFQHTNGFKRDPVHGLYIEGRHIKSMMKEVVSIEFPYPEFKWGVTRKSPKDYAAENVYFDPDHIYLNRRKEDGIEFIIGHPKTPKGRVANLSYVEYVLQPTIVFGVKSARHRISEEDWRIIWTHAQENGLGAKRSSGFARFDILDFDECSKAEWLEAVNYTPTFSEPVEEGEPVAVGVG